MTGWIGSRAVFSASILLLSGLFCFAESPQWERINQLHEKVLSKRAKILAKEAAERASHDSRYEEMDFNLQKVLDKISDFSRFPMREKLKEALVDEIKRLYVSYGDSVPKADDLYDLNIRGIAKLEVEQMVSAGHDKREGLSKIRKRTGDEQVVEEAKSVYENALKIIPNTKEIKEVEMADMEIQRYVMESLQESKSASRTIQKVPAAPDRKTYAPAAMPPKPANIGASFGEKK